MLDVAAGAIEIGVKELSVYAFSTENWRRSPGEVRFIMGFARKVLRVQRDVLNSWNVRLRWIGRTPRLWKSVLHELREAERVTAPAGGLLHHPFTLTAANRGGLLSVALACGLPRVDVIHHPVLWSPDFPRSTYASRLPRRPVSPNPLYAYPWRRLFSGFVSRVL